MFLEEENTSSFFSFCKGLKLGISILFYKFMI